MAQWVRQAAAIPLSDGQVCLVTSSSGRRWVIPKGMIEPGHTAGETSLRETWEEAGLAGVLHQEPVGSYLYEKNGCLFHVTVFVMQVTEVAEDWPERLVRQRTWFSAEEVLERIQEPGLREILETVFHIPRSAERTIVAIESGTT